uniref:Uncharacterized protein n=1 Tax=viral metagenome TaxID=1070528 RepID=A0A6M3XKQ4_9ZZZZ
MDDAAECEPLHGTSWHPVAELRIVKLRFDPLLHRPSSGVWVVLRDKQFVFLKLAKLKLRFFVAHFFLRLWLQSSLLAGSIKGRFVAKRPFHDPQIARWRL